MEPLVLRSLRLIVATAAVAMLTGLSMYAFPAGFSVTIYAPLVPYLHVFSPLLVAAGVSLLLLARYQLAGWHQRVLLYFPAFMMGILSAAIWAAGGVTGGMTYATLALGLLLSPRLRVGSRLNPAPDSAYRLFDVVLGTAQVAAGATMLFAPGLLTSPAFNLLRGFFPLVGAVGVITGGLQISALILPVLRPLTPWKVRLPGTILPMMMTVAFYSTRAWTGVVLWGVLTVTSLAGCVVLPGVLKRIQQLPPAPVAPEEFLSARLEAILESWLWLLALLVIALTGLGERTLIASPVRAVLFVIGICAYNALVHWAVPNWGSSSQRILAHMVALMAGSALLLGDTGAIGRPVLAFLVILPALAARALSPASGMTTLGLTLAVVTVSGIDHLLHGRPAGLVFAESLADAVILAASATIGLRFALDQRRSLSDLATARSELARQVQELSLIDRIGRAIRSSLELDKTIQTIVDELGPALQAERCVIRLLSPGDPSGTALATEYVSADLTHAPSAGENLGLVGFLAVRERIPVAVDDVTTDPRLVSLEHGTRDELLASGIRSALCVPIQAEGEILGVISFHMFTTTRVWTEDELHFVETVAGQVAVALLHARTHATLRHRHAELNTAHQHLQARDEELMAQQEELQAQHEELIAQSEALQSERDKLEEALVQIRAGEQDRERLVAVLESTTDFVAILNQDGRVHYMNQAVRNLLGLSADEEPTVELRRWYTRESLLRIRRLALTGMARHGVWSGELTVRRYDGRLVPISQVAIAHKDAEGRVLYFSTVARDISTAKRAEEELRHSETRFRTAFSHAPIGMALVSPAGQILQANQALCEMLGYDEAELLGSGVSALSYPEDHRQQAQYTDRLLRGEIDSYQMEKRYVHKSGRLVWTLLSVSAVRSAENELEYLISHVQDITERKRSEQELVHLANYDPLTRLYNRHRLQEELEHEIRSAERYGHESALLYLDLDQFKYVNDTLGHQSGDTLLVSLAALMRERLRRTDTVARLGGDEFAIILPHVDAQQAMAVAASLIKSIREHVEVAGSVTYGISASVGITIFPTQGHTVEEVLANADLAMYQAKEDGRNGYCLYAPDLVKAHQMETKLTWERRIRQALEHDRFELHRQPIFDLAAGEVSQYELLLRMQGESGELYHPHDFLEIAERFGLIVAIDRWVVRRAIATIAEQERAGQRIVLDVNLSGKAFADGELLALIRHELEATGIDPRSLVFEVTETAAIADKRRAREFLETLRTMGCRIALDDFGTGFSSFAYLKHLPFDYLKIDGSFIQRLPSDPVDQRVVKAIVDLARGLGKQTVAEFVEDAATVKLLRELGVDFAQGYHMGPPSLAVHGLSRGRLV